MKLVKLLATAFALSATLILSGCSGSDVKPSNEKAATTEPIPMEKMGFLTIESCAAQGAFLDCYLENYMCATDGCFLENEPGVFTKVQIVLYSHEDGIAYNVDTTNIDMRFIDKGINRNDVTLVGDFYPSTNTIVVTEFKAPPPPKKSFFKGCL